MIGRTRRSGACCCDGNRLCFNSNINNRGSSTNTSSPSKTHSTGSTTSRGGAQQK